jgi:PEP-CTERM motif-containing protein
VKAILLASALVSGVATVLAQGTVVFNNRVVGSVVTHVYGPNPANLAFHQTGNGPLDTPAGTTDWAGWPPLSGSGYSAQLWAAPGLSQPESSLQPAFPITTFRTGAAAGWVVGVTATLPNVPGDDLGGVTMIMRIWDNAGGTITSWTDAMASSQVPVAESPSFNLTAPIGGTFNVPPNLVGLQSFNFAWIPEPTTLALATLGIALLVLARHRSR